MTEKSKLSALILGLSICLGLATLGYLLADAAITIKGLERSVKVKGLSEREYPADIVIWPIQFIAADNNLQNLYQTLENNTEKIVSFLKQHQIKDSDISNNPPAITDKSAQRYANAETPRFRYSAVQTVTVYSSNVDTVRTVMGALAELGKEGIVFSSEDYEARPEYIFTKLNEVKPTMIEEATRKARAVAQKFAQDSQSRLGKIKKASQGQFSISARDKSTPHMKRVRVVSTVEYYLSD
ncbi:MAG: SIMPL domain-containing protein [Deltaproteobacteria bacterium]|nr:SIMPL domain-containing protein [Candidatus Tharpella sp.]